MAEAIVTFLIEQLASVAVESLKEKVSLVKNVESDVNKLKSNLEAIQAVLEDAEKKQLTNLSVKLWVKRLKEASFEMDNVLDEWYTDLLQLKIQREAGQDDQQDNTTKKKACFSIASCFCAKVNRLALRREIAHKIKDLNKKLADITSEKDQFNLSITTTENTLDHSRITTSFIDETEVEGRDEEKEVLVNSLLDKNSTPNDKGLHIIPIVGMGGLGKTTLAQFAYNDEKVKAHFDLRIWVCVSDPFDVIKVAKTIIESIERSSPNINELENLLQRIETCVEGKRFLLVLDDVWTKESEKWDKLKQPLKHGALGSKVVVTTRKEEVVMMMGAMDQMFKLQKLTEENCWLVFKQRAFSGRKDEECQQLEEIGRKIASKSKGLPLVAKSLGSLMCFQKSKSQWEDVLCSELWNLEVVNKEIFTPFLLGYYDLSAREKLCFSYCVVFPKDFVMDRNDLIKMWMSQSYLSDEKDGHKCFENLVMRSFFQIFSRGGDGSVDSCEMHDIVHDFAQFLTKNECVTMEVLKDGRSMNLLHENTHHLTLVTSETIDQFSALHYSEANIRNLRTLFVSSSNISNVDSLYQQLTCLRSLTLSDCQIKKLPSSIGDMKHLRFLDLSENHELEELPKRLCDLCNLQTLNLYYCSSLLKLPEGIGRLINLRYLYVKDCDKLKGFPKSIGKLKSLRSLDTLFVTENKEMFFDIVDLNRFSNFQLEDIVYIKECRNLGIRNDFGVEQLDLKNISQQVTMLNLDFGEWREGISLEKESSILQGLEPHHNLQYLFIDNYMGTVMSPRWLDSLINLVSICIYNIGNCEMLPSLGKLPSLESILIFNFPNVKNVGLEFLGIENEGDTAPTSPSITLFPKLKKLEFMKMGQWEKWEGSSNSTVMPCLTTLKFKRCPRLQVLPDFLKMNTSLQNLEIRDSEIIEEWCQNKTGNKEWEKISHAPNIMVDDVYVKSEGEWIQEEGSSSEHHPELHFGVPIF